MDFTFAAIVVAAGKGLRFGSDTPKQHMLLSGLPVLHHAVKALARHPSIRKIVVVCSADWRNLLAGELSGLHSDIVVAAGGDTRQASVAAGLAALDDQDASHVLIHDGARPLLADADLDRLIAAAAPDRGATLAVAVSDTMVRLADDGGLYTVPRENLHAVQTPQMFPLASIARFHAEAQNVGVNYTDDTTLAQAFGMVIDLVGGSPDNIKITHPGDLARAEQILNSRRKA